MVPRYSHRVLITSLPLCTCFCFPILPIFNPKVDCRGINDAAKHEIWNAAQDHEISFPEFQAWLIRATKFYDGRNSNVQAMYDKHPELGKRYQPKGDVEEYSWNASTMSQVRLVETSVALTYYYIVC